MTSRKLLAAAALPLAFLATVAPATAKRLSTVASFTVLADVVKQVGGDHVRVTSLVGPNGDPHAFEPSPQDAQQLKSADLVFVSGLGLEGWMDRLIAASGYAGRPVVVSEGMRTLTMEEDGATVTDPHVWNSPTNVEAWVTVIETALAKADPDDAADFEANAEAYTGKLKELDGLAHALFSGIAKDERKVLTSHDAFGYFARDYGVAFLSPVGLSTDAEPSAADVAKLITQIRAEKVKVYFFENSSDPRLVKQIAAATGAEPGGELYVEALSEPSGPAPDYATMFRRNVELLSGAMRTQ